MIRVESTRTFAPPLPRGVGQPSWSVRRLLQWCLGGLWLLDSFLQMQPTMFTLNTVTNVLQPTVQMNPAPLAHLEQAMIHWVSPHIAWWNFGFAAVQFMIAVLLLMDRPLTVKWGLRLSIGWGFLVWIFGEGLGGILTGSATMLGGAPGSVMLYVWLAALLLLPDTAWQFAGQKWQAVRDGPSVLWLLAALQQAAAPQYWTGVGLSGVFQSSASGQPNWMATVLHPMVTLAQHHPLPTNAVLVALFLVVGICTAGRFARPWAFWLGFAVLAFAWVFGQGCGMLLIPGTATDPNSAPVWALLMIPGWSAFRASRAGTVHDDPMSQNARLRFPSDRFVP